MSFFCMADPVMIMLCFKMHIDDIFLVWVLYLIEIDLHEMFRFFRFLLMYKKICESFDNFNRKVEWQGALKLIVLVVKIMILAVACYVYPVF